LKLEIRLEEKNDCRKVEELIRESFWNLYIPGATEHLIVHSLRNSKVFVPELNFVAIKDGKLVGQIFYTKAKIIDINKKYHDILTFGPISVASEFRNLGIGKALIEHSKKIANELGYKGIIIYGYPDYYNKIGFQSAAKYGISREDGVFAKALLAMELYPNSLEGLSGRFHEYVSAFEINEEELSKFDSSFPEKEKKYEQSQDLFMKMTDQLEEPENIKSE